MPNESYPQRNQTIAAYDTLIQEIVEHARLAISKPRVPTRATRGSSENASRHFS